VLDTGCWSASSIQNPAFEDGLITPVKRSGDCVEFETGDMVTEEITVICKNKLIAYPNTLQSLPVREVA
jgi:hypothetical protein